MIIKIIPTIIPATAPPDKPRFFWGLSVCVSVVKLHSNGKLSLLSWDIVINSLLSQN